MAAIFCNSVGCCNPKVSGSCVNAALEGSPSTVANWLLACAGVAPEATIALSNVVNGLIGTSTCAGSVINVVMLLTNGRFVERSVPPVTVRWAFKSCVAFRVVGKVYLPLTSV